MNNRLTIGYWSLLIGMLIGITISLIFYDKTYPNNNCKTITESK